jgi:hypothetical protein
VRFAVYQVARRVCEELNATGERPLRGFRSSVVRRTESGGFEATRDPGPNDERSGFRRRP